MTLRRRVENLENTEVDLSVVPATTGDREAIAKRYRVLEDPCYQIVAALLEAGRGEQAEAVYRRDLRWNQNNGWSLFGLQRSLAMQGKDAQAQDVLSQYQAAWRNSDLMLAASRL